MSRVALILDSIVTTLATDPMLEGAKVYIGLLPDTIVYPCVRMYPIGGQVVGHLGGESDLRNMLWEVDSFASTLLQAIRIGERLREVLTQQMGATLTFAPISLPEVGTKVQRYTFQASLWA